MSARSEYSTEEPTLKAAQAFIRELEDREIEAYCLAGNLRVGKEEAERRCDLLERAMLDAASKLSEFGNEEPLVVAAHLVLVAHQRRASLKTQENERKELA